MYLSRWRSWFNARIGWLLALLTASVCAGSLVFAQTGGGDSPLSIQRIFIKPDRAAKELEKVQQSALLLLPRQEFEDRVERIQQAYHAREKKPHLIQAHYSAELVGRSFANGWGKWAVLHPGSVPAILSVDPLNLALARPRWEQGGDAILAEFDGKSLGLLVKQSGNDTCLFDWSARGAVTQEGLAFSLAVPPCPFSTFDLILPTDDWLTIPKATAVVTGPHDTESPSKRLWKLQVTGSKPVELLVRKVAAPKGVGATIFARAHSIQQLAPDRLAVDHDFQLDVLHGSVRKLVLDGDAGLQPYAVTLPGGEVKSWKWEENPAKPGPKGSAPPDSTGVLTIDFHEPLQGKIHGLRVRSLVARSASGLWTSPSLRVRDALPRGETLEVRLHSDLAVGKWDSGSFQLTSIATDPDGAQKLTLAETAPDVVASRRPTLILPVKGADVHTTEKYVWHINQRGATLAAEIQYAPARGNLFELRVKLPKTFPGYQIESLEMLPAEMLGGWHPDGDFLVVELKQALTAPKRVTLKVKMRAGLRDITTGIRVLNYPELEPIDGTKRDGTLAIVIDPIFRTQLVNSSVPLAASDDADFVKNGREVGYLLRFRDQRLSAAVRLEPQPVQVQLQGKHAITLTEQQTALKFHWETQPLVGTPEFLDFRLAPGFPASWKVNAPDDTLSIHHWERLPLQEALPYLLHLGGGSGAQRAALQALLPAGSYWRFHLSEPLQKKSAFTLEATSAPGVAAADGKLWSAPLMLPVQSTNISQQVTVDSPREPINKFSVGTRGIPPAQQTVSKLPKPLNQLILQADGLQIPAANIALWTRPDSRAVSPLRHCDEARQTAFVYKDGRVYHRIQFRLWHWHDRTCEMNFPRDLHVIAVKIHDQWLQRLDVVEAMDQVRLTLPVDQNVPFVRFEILVHARPPDGSLSGVVAQVEMPRIAWPSTPQEVQRRVCLAKGWTPLGTDSLTRIGVPREIARQSETPRRIRQIWNLGQSWWSDGEHASLQEELDIQKKNVLLAESQMRAGGGKLGTLSETLQQFALLHLKDQVPLVIDAVAFQSLGLAPESKIATTGRPFWETLGLIYVPCPSGALLTSPRRSRSLRIDDSMGTAELDEALQEAIMHGRDSSSGFCLLPTWLRMPQAESNLFTSVPTSSGADTIGDFQDMSEWEVGVDGTEAMRFYVVDCTCARVLGWLVALLAALILWKLQRAMEPLACFRLFLSLLTAGALLVIWSPVHFREYLVLPVFLVQAAGFLWCSLSLIVWRPQRDAQGKSTLTHIATPAAALGFLLLGMTWNAAAQPPPARVYTVFVIDGAKPMVLVTPDLMAKLDELEKQPAGTPGAVLVSAKYAGKVKDTVATIEANFEVYALKEKTNLVIPLTGVQLGADVFLDGAPVFPSPHKNGYSLPIRGKGMHHLRLSFTDKATHEADQLNLAFKIPKVAQNELVLKWLTPAREVYCQHSCGEEKSLFDRADGVKEWRAQLGYENVVNLRWTDGPGSRSGQAIEAKETHFWDLRPASLALQSSLNYTIGTGTISQLVIAVPERLHVRAVEALTAPAPSPTATPIVIKRWAIAGAGDQRRLTVEFAQPVTGNVTLNLDLVPQAFTQQSDLRLLLPTPSDAKTGAGLLGYLLDATELLGKANNLRLLGINVEDFEQHWKKQSSMPLPGVSCAYNFQRESSKAAWLELKTQPTAWQAQGLVQWRLDAQHADLNAKLTISSAREDLNLVEFFIDKSMTLADVAGPDVRRWHLHETRLQVWLRQPRKETTLTLTGWRSFPAKGPAAAEKVFVVPCIYPLQTSMAAINLEVIPASRTQLRLKHSLNLRLNAARSFEFTIEKAPYEATFGWAAEFRPREASTLTKVQRVEQGMDIWHVIRLTPERGHLPSIKLHLKDWPHEPLLLDAPGATAVQPISNKLLKHPAWTIQYPLGLPREVFVILRGRVGADKQASVSLPVVEIEDFDIRRHLVAWKDVEIVQVESGKKLTAQKAIKDVADADAKADWLQEVATWNLASAGLA